MTDQENVEQLIDEITDEVVRLVAAGKREDGETAVSPSAAANVDTSNIAALIDHTLLKPEATQAQIAALCHEAATHRFASVCVNPVFVPLAAQLLRASPVVVCTVVGFPLGAMATSVKAFETKTAVREGAAEIDMVLNIGALKSGDYATVLADIETVVQAAHTAGAIVKVIIEAALLNDDEKVMACRLAQAANADYVKTSTGFGPGGATIADVVLMRDTVGPKLGVKAAGGIRSYQDAVAMVEAGATRLGASAGVRIVQEANSNS